MSPNATESDVLNETSATYMGAVSLGDIQVPEGFSPSLSPALDQSMFFAPNGRRKRLWLMTVPPDTDIQHLEGAKLKKYKCVTACGTTRFNVSTRVQKNHQAIVVHKELGAAAVRMRLAGSVSLRKQIEVPDLKFALPEDKMFASFTDARQRFVPFGADEPKVQSKEIPDGGVARRNKRKHSQKHSKKNK